MYLDRYITMVACYSRILVAHSSVKIRFLFCYHSAVMSVGLFVSIYVREIPRNGIKFSKVCI